MGKRSSQFAVDKTLDVKAGDQVIVAIDENALVQSSLLMYLLPMIVMLCAGILAEFLFVAESITILSVLAGLIFSMFFVRYLLSRSSLKKSIQPHLIRRIS